MDYSYYPAQASYYQSAAFAPTSAFDPHADHAHDPSALFNQTTSYDYEPSYQFAPQDVYLPDDQPQPSHEQDDQQEQQQPPHHVHDQQPHQQDQQQQSSQQLPHSLQQHSPPVSSHRHSVVSLGTDQPSSTSLTDMQTNGDIDLQDQQTKPQLQQQIQQQQQQQQQQNGQATHSLSYDQNGNRSSSEDKEVTPAQTRRKAQNRAAQRAFRERKERHVKELESKLNSLSAHSSTLLGDNERLKRELQRLATQNEILRAKSTLPSGPPRMPSPVHGPQTYSPTDFQTAVGLDPNMHELSYENFGGEAGNRLLAAGAAWDLIQAHDLYQKHQLDVADVFRRLKGKAACDGRGPAFRESEVLHAIESSVHIPSDELI